MTLGRAKKTAPVTPPLREAFERVLNSASDALLQSLAIGSGSLWSKKMLIEHS